MSGHILSLTAEDDLVAIWCYVFEFEASDRRANEKIKKIYKTFDKLAAFPEFGTPREEYGPGVVGFPCDLWVVYFRRCNEGVEIIRVTGEEEDVLPRV